MLHQELTKTIIGCAYTVHNTLGAGFLEKVYEQALMLELKASGLVVESQVPLAVSYRDHIVGEYYADLIVEDKVVCELKAVDVLKKAHEVQLVNYLVATGIDVGVLINFGDSVTVKRKYREYKNKRYNYVSEILSYTNIFKDRHSINLLGGHSWQNMYEEGFKAEVRNIDPFYEDVAADNLKAYSELEWGYSTSFRNTPEGLASFFSRAIYDFDKKYYTTLSLRRDKSTKYGDDIEWGTFWAVSGAWNINKEAFMKNINRVSDLRLRVGYGLTGNADIPNNIDRVRYQPTSKGIDSETGQEIIIWNNNSGNCLLETYDAADDQP